MIIIGALGTLLLRLPALLSVCELWGPQRHPHGQSTFRWIKCEHERLIHNAGYTDEMIGLSSSLQRYLNFVYHKNIILTSYPAEVKLSIPIPAIRA